MRYTVTKAFRPKGSGSPEVAAGSELDLTDSQARVFKALNWVKESDSTSQPARPFSPPTYERRDMTAAEPTVPVRRWAAKKVAAKKTAARTDDE